MAKSKYPNIRYAIICEDIRQEIGNKVSLMGVFHKNINIPIPYILPKLCFRVIFDGVPESHTLAARLYDPDETVLNKARLDLPPKPEGNVSSFTIDLAFAGLKIEKAGSYSLSFSFDKDKGKRSVDFDVIEVKNELE